jgi:hypothetical protein
MSLLPPQFGSDPWLPRGHGETFHVVLPACRRWPGLHRGGMRLRLLFRLSDQNDPNPRPAYGAAREYLRSLRYRAPQPPVTSFFLVTLKWRAVTATSGSERGFTSPCCKIASRFLANHSARASSLAPAILPLLSLSRVASASNPLSHEPPPGLPPNK